MTFDSRQVRPEDAARVREVLVQAQEPLLSWLSDAENGPQAVAIVRELAQKGELHNLECWVAESENVQAAFRHIRELMRDDLMPSGEGVEPEDAEHMRGVLLRSAQEVVAWLENERNATSMIGIVLEIGETYDIERVMKRFENDWGRLLAQRVFHVVRARMMGGRPVSGTTDLAGLAARGAFSG